MMTELFCRVSLAGYKISRYPANIARYKMIRHSAEQKNPLNKCRYRLMKKTKQRWQKDGLSNLKYRLLQVDQQPLFTRIYVDLLEKVNG
jgi:hypothetical protein